MTGGCQAVFSALSVGCVVRQINHDIVKFKFRQEKVQARVGQEASDEQAVGFFWMGRR